MRQSLQALATAALAAALFSTGLFTGVVTAFDHVSVQAVQTAQANANAPRG